MSRWYRWLYRFGITPWEADTEPLARQLRTLVKEEESASTPPHGPALDLGCGTGRWSIELATRGWEVVGVDVVPKAIRMARRHARSAGVDIEFIEGDVTRLREVGAGSGFSLLLDVECFNHLNDAQREAMSGEVNSVVAPDATLLLLVWQRGRRGPLPPGANRDDLEKVFPQWRIVAEEAYAGDMPGPLRHAAPRWYRLTHL